MRIDQNRRSIVCRFEETPSDEVALGFVGDVHLPLFWFILKGNTLGVHEIVVFSFFVPKA